MIAHVKCKSSLCVGACASPIKSSMYTSNNFASFLLSIRSVVGSSHSAGKHNCSSGCGGNVALVSRSSCALSLAVSDAEQNNGGDLHHPICKQVGFTIWIGSFSFTQRRT